MGDFLYSDSFETECKTVRETTFRQFRLGQWSTGPLDQWMTPELWASRNISPGDISDGAEVVLALDGSFSADTTARRLHRFPG